MICLFIRVISRLLPISILRLPNSYILEEKCYKFFGASENERLQYKQARDACWALGENHDLVSIHSMKEQGKKFYESYLLFWFM